MKPSVCIILVFCFLLTGRAQLTGRLVTVDSLPLAFANISLLKSNDSSFVTAGQSGGTGHYRFGGIHPGKYILQFSSVGYVSQHSGIVELTGKEQTVEMGTMVLKAVRAELHEVVVVGKKPLYQLKPEGLVVNVESSLLSKGSTALEVLERSPGVVINRRDNSIGLNGKNGVAVMLDGKLVRMSMEQLVTLLAGMSADEIASIELLTTPSAKHDAEGSAGIINIVLKKNKKPGTNAGVSFTAGYALREKGMGSFNISHSNRRLNWYGAYNYSHDRSVTDMSVESAQHMPFLGGDVYTTGWFNTNYARNSHDVNIDADAKLNSRTSIGMGIGYHNTRLSGAAVTDASYNVLPDSLLRFNGLNRGRNVWSNMNTSLYLEKAIKEGEKFNISLDYLRFSNKDNSAVQSSFINKHGLQAGSNEMLFAPAQQGFANTGIGVGVLKADYTRQAGKKIKIEAGIKAAYTSSTSASGIQSLVNNVWTGSSQTSNNIIMKEVVGAAYVSANSQLSESWQLVTGLRYEYSNTNMDNSQTGANIVNRKLGAFFPAVFLSKKVGGNSELQFSYTKRISRPSYNDLASYVGYSDPTAVYTGNPFLQPTITHNLKLGYTSKGYAFSLMLSRDNNAIARYQLTESPARNILYISPQNLAWQNNLTLQVAVPVKVNTWWSMSYGISVGPRWYTVNYTKNPLQYHYLGYSFNAGQVFLLPRQLSAEISGWYNSTVYNGTQRVQGFGALNAGIKKELKKNAGSLQLSVTDILTSQRYDVRYGTVTQEAFDIKSHVIVSPESSLFPVIKLTYSKSFGGAKEQRKQPVNTQDERNRVNN